MTSLNKYIDNHNQEIEETQEQILEIQKQLRELEQQLRVKQQLHQAQKTAEVEVSKSLSHLKKLFKDLCSIYPPSALDDLADEIADMAEEVKKPLAKIFYAIIKGYFFANLTCSDVQNI